MTFRTDEEAQAYLDERKAALRKWCEETGHHSRWADNSDGCWGMMPDGHGSYTVEMPKWWSLEIAIRSLDFGLRECTPGLAARPLVKGSDHWLLYEAIQAKAPEADVLARLKEITAKRDIEWGNDELRAEMARRKKASARQTLGQAVVRILKWFRYR